MYGTELMYIQPHSHLLEDNQQCLSPLCIPSLALNAWGTSGAQQIFDELKMAMRDGQRI